ncbi:MAG: alpha-amylase [Muribaculaceae bacterium]|nr:alpha-amylase [Muribaculaceae bacterium]
MKRFAVFSAIASMIASLFQANAAAPTTVKHPDWSRNAVIYEVNLRQYTDSGKVTDFAKELPRLKELGVDILWFMPIHPISELNRKGELGSYYAVKDYKAFNPEYGTIDEFKQVVEQAHKLGMKVILDWVPNHTGCDNPWVKKHPDWYAKDKDGKMYGPYDWTDVYKLDYSNPKMRKGMIDALKFWLTEVGVDGYRCDVASEVPVDFWDEARVQLQRVKPDLFMLAEASEPKLQVNAFDMGYNWPMKDLFSAIAATSGEYTFSKDGEPMRTFPATTAVAIDTLLAKQAAEYPADTYLMNMITNHDLNSWEGTEFDRLGNLADAFAVLSYTLPGMPLIYTGQETGMNRAFEFFVKDKAPQWEPRNGYFNFYKKLNALKHDHKALNAGAQGGEMQRFPTTDDNIYVFQRTVDDDNVLVMVNLGEGPAVVPVDYTQEQPSVEGMINYFTGKEEALPSSLQNGEWRIYVTE